MTTDPWQHMLYQIEPAYDQYKEIVERGPKYIIDLTQDKKGKSQLCILEENNLLTSGLGGLDEKCKWAEEQLASWPNCRRIAWNIWEFKHRQDAEKFRTLFTLKWAQ